MTHTNIYHIYTYKGRIRLLMCNRIFIEFLATFFLSYKYITEKLLTSPFGLHFIAVLLLWNWPIIMMTGVGLQV